MPLFRNQFISQCHQSSQTGQNQLSGQLFAHWHKYHIIKGIKHRSAYFTISGLNRLFSLA